MTKIKFRFLNVVFMLILAVILTACASDAIKTERTQNNQISVGLLFEKDGYKVYRFDDGGRYVYYVIPSGQVIWNESCGKNCSRQVQVQTLPETNTNTINKNANSNSSK